MLMASIKNIAGDCEKTHRWCTVNLTGDDANNFHNSMNLTQCRIIGIGRKKVRLLRASGQIVKVEPFLIQTCW